MTARISLILREARAHRARLQLLFRSEDQLRHRKPCGITLFRVRFSWASLFRWYALKNARVPPAIVLSRLRRGKNGQTPEPLLAKEGCSPGRRLSQTPVCSGRLRVCSLRLAAVAYGFQKKTRGGSRPRSDVQTRIRPA